VLPYDTGVQMYSSSSSGPATSSTIVVEIVESLEACGLDRTDYQLHDTVDVDALEQLLTTSSGDVAVQFTVEGVQLVVTTTGVQVVLEDSVNEEDQ